MKVTAIRIDGKKPTEKQLQDIIKALQKAFEKKGYKTYIDKLNSVALKIANSAGTFSIDTEKLGRTFRRDRNPWSNEIRFRSGRGVPTWDQRVDFNNTLNQVLDSLGVSATVGASGGFKIRKGTHSFTEDDWNDLARCKPWLQQINDDLYTEQELKKLYPEYYAENYAPKKKKSNKKAAKNKAPSKKLPNNVVQLHA